MLLVVCCAMASSGRPFQSPISKGAAAAILASVAEVAETASTIAAGSLVANAAPEQAMDWLGKAAEHSRYAAECIQQARSALGVQLRA